MQSKEKLPHREAKKIRTRLSLEESATALVLERGSSHVTVEDICEQVGVSKRTFFNYFASKDEAILGEAPKEPTEAQRNEFLAKEDVNLVDHTAVFLSTLSSSSTINWELLSRRKQIMTKEPELRTQHLSTFHDAKAGMQDLLVEYLERHPGARRIPNATTAQEAKLIMAIAVMAIHSGTIMLNGLIGRDDIDLENEFALPSVDLLRAALN